MTDANAKPDDVAALAEAEFEARVQAKRIEIDENYTAVDAYDLAYVTVQLEDERKHVAAVTRERDALAVRLCEPPLSNAD